MKDRENCPILFRISAGKCGCSAGAQSAGQTHGAGAQSLGESLVEYAHRGVAAAGMEALHVRSTAFTQEQTHRVADTEVVDQGTEVSPKASINRVGQVGSIGPYYYTTFLPVSPKPGARKNRKNRPNAASEMPHKNGKSRS